MAKLLTAVAMRVALLTVWVGLAAGGVAVGQTWRRGDVDFGEVEQRAKELAAAPWQAPNKEGLPEWLRKLSYDQYRDIRFRPEMALWAADKLPFRAMLFHPGYLFVEPVAMNEFTDTHRQRVRLTEDFFSYGPLVGQRGELPPDAGFAGFRLHAPMNRPDVFDEVIAFQGASYWRALAKGQRYGLSARGLAIDTGMEGGEEFPAFREFWLEKPHADDQAAMVRALLDSPSVTGAYAFVIEPGDSTVVKVKAVLFLRRAVKRFGVAPLSSMYWFGENSRRRFDDFRPEVHDSDGLAIRMGTGERIWRPLANDSGRVEFSFFGMPNCGGFGLVQRDRRVEAYEDSEAAYHLRPSVWIEPSNEWGAGKVMLMEIPAEHEVGDNVVALWQPDRVPQAGERVEFCYKQSWTDNPDPAGAGGHVVATRTGVHKWQPGQRGMVVEFRGGALDALPDDAPPQAMVELTGEGPPRVKVQDVAVHRLPDRRWRVNFQLLPADGVEPAAVGPVELRCSLRRGEDFLSETWAYRIIPWPEAGR